MGRNRRQRDHEHPDEHFLWHYSRPGCGGGPVCGSVGEGGYASATCDLGQVDCPTCRQLVGQPDVPDFGLFDDGVGPRDGLTVPSHQVDLHKQPST